MLFCRPQQFNDLNGAPWLQSLRAMHTTGCLAGVLWMKSNIWLPIVAAIGVSTAVAGCGGAARAKAVVPAPPPVTVAPAPPPAPPPQPVDPVTALIGTSQ